MRQPQRGGVTRPVQTASTLSVPAPVGGWNTRDSVAAMPTSDALTLDNWFPNSSDVILRKGIGNHVTGFSNRVESLMSYAPATGSNKLFAGCNNGIFDATTAGAVGAAVTALTEGYGQHINFRTAAGSFLQFVNGVDNLKLFDGTTWTTVTNVSVPAITGLATTELVHVNVFKRRIWYTQKNSLSLWYLPVDSIAGALTEYPMGQFFVKGGFIMAAATWTIDGGTGADDYLVVISSEGELAVFQGVDPGDANSFGIVGVFYIGQPIGRRCFTKYGGDILYLSRQGLLPLSKALQTASIDRSIALSDKISPSFTAAADSYNANQGWQVTSFPAANMVIVNIPTFVGTQYLQYVMNTLNGSWCSFSGWNMNCWEVFNGNLYGGGETIVARAWNGVSDFGANITAIGKTAYNYMNQRIQLKHMKLVRPVITTDRVVTLQYGLDTDFEATDDFSVQSLGPAGTAIWDSSTWDSGIWVGDSTTLREWSTVNNQDFFAASFVLQAITLQATVRWLSTDYVYELGGVV